MTTNITLKVNEVTARRQNVDEERRRLKELVLYVADRCSSDDKFGSTKLNKILLAADVHSYLLYGTTISKAQYMKEKAGPVPVQMKPVLEEMVGSGDIVMQLREYWGNFQKRPVRLRFPNLEEFSGNDIAILDQVINACKHLNASEMSHLSHGLSWTVAEKGAVIPMQAFLFKDEQTLTDRIQQQGLALRDERGWNV